MVRSGYIIGKGEADGDRAVVTVELGGKVRVVWQRSGVIVDFASCTKLFSVSRMCMMC